MAEHGFQTKKKVVTIYLNGNGSYGEFTTKYGIGGKRLICK